MRSRETKPEHQHGSHHEDDANYADPAKYRGSNETGATVGKGTIYTCPMHPQIRRTEPGNCPICGMALEPVNAAEEAGPSPELIDMTRRFWIGTVLAIPTVILEMGAHFPRLNLHHYVHAGRLVGRLAVFRSRLGIRPQPLTQHV